jgi:hypothetical protein
MFLIISITVSCELNQSIFLISGHSSNCLVLSRKKYLQIACMKCGLYINQKIFLRLLEMCFGTIEIER